MKRATLPASPADELLIVRDALVPKLSARSAGSKIGYKLGCTLDKSEAYFKLTANQSAGYFSIEWVPLSKIAAKLSQLANAGSFPAIALKSVFVGRSVNNASFLAAALVAEGVLKPEADKAFKLQIACDPATWREGLFDLPGEIECLIPPVVETPEGSPNAEGPATSNAPKKSKKGSRPKTDEGKPASAPEQEATPELGADDADHPQSE